MNVDYAMRTPLWGQPEHPHAACVLVGAARQRCGVGFSGRCRYAGVVATPWTNIDLHLQTRFICVREYLTSEIATHGLTPNELAKVRFALAEVAAPMSLHLGLVQISLFRRPVLHVLYDTTDNERFPHAFAHVAFDKGLAELAPLVAGLLGVDLGAAIEAFERDPLT